MKPGMQLNPRNLGQELLCYKVKNGNNKHALMKYLVDAELDMENRKTFPIIEQCLYTSKKIQMQ